MNLSGRQLSYRPDQAIQHHPSSAGRSNDLQLCDRSQQFTMAPELIAVNLK
ncbi:hypothetical protein BDV28DRAFT_153330 [Aspergillus coremiiformis]|uniref:Uncharacterized protein n=1 Tax=Aspergillus coremiiformis TaxID=138285 RepID=A0A5N6YRA9_9EURO|nr:hypothetical protein BDV28DRAFT_153330 [Aspergillus coremiiformis]